MTALLAACATGPDVKSDYDHQANFAQYRTFGYMTPLGTDKAGYSTLLTERLKNATRGQMEMRGYTYSAANPDLLLNFSAKLQQKVQVTPAPPPMVRTTAIAPASTAVGPATAGAMTSTNILRAP